jgi:AraC-like DNA-binding protein
MDVHIIPGVKAKDVAEAHQKDVALQNEFSCKCMTYWVDENRENVFCLIEAPEKHIVEEMHRQAHGLIPHKIIEVSSVLVESFLGRVQDPDNAETTKDGLKVFHEPSMRFLLVTKITDPVLLRYKFGSEKANDLLSKQDLIIRENLASYSGREASYQANNFVASFSSATKAVACALSILKDMAEANMSDTGFCVAVNAGEPVTESDKLFGDTILLAKRMCSVAKENQMAITSNVRELVSQDYFKDNGTSVLNLSPVDETLLDSLFNTLEEHYADPDLNVTDYCQKLAMSQSQLYRKTMALFDVSPNELMREFRLDKALERMKKKRYNISEITFDTGFTSPSYFTKCFKRKFGLLPMTYVDLSH